MRIFGRILGGWAIAAGAIGFVTPFAVPSVAQAGKAWLAQAPTFADFSRAAGRGKPGEPEKPFITQYPNPRYNPTVATANNANCGPTSLAMALRTLHREPPGYAEPRQAQDLVRKVRFMMTGETDEQAWTYPFQVQLAARQAGLAATTVHGFEALRAEMAKPGRVAVLNLNPHPVYAQRLAIPFDGGHFAFVPELGPDDAVVHDPLASGPLRLSLAELKRAMETPLGRDPNGRDLPAFDGGVVIHAR